MSTATVAARMTTSFCPGAISTPYESARPYGIGAVNYHTGKLVMLVRCHTRRREIAELPQVLLDAPPMGTISVAWDTVSTHTGDGVEAVVRSAAGRLVVLYLPTH